MLAAGGGASGSGVLERLRIGFVGAGRTARRHAEVLRSFPDVRIAGIADPAFARAEALAAPFGARAFATQGRMLREVALDALFLCVPPCAHGLPERAALAHGLPFLIEPPLALDAALALEIAERVREIGLVTAVALPWRHCPAVEAARAALAEDPPHLLAGCWLEHPPSRRSWRRMNGTSGRGLAQATRLLDLAGLLAGEITEVQAATSGRAPEGPPRLGGPASAATILRFATGAIASLASTRLPRSAPSAALRIFTAGHMLELTERDLAEEAGAPGEEATRRQDRAFLDAVLGREDQVRAPYGAALGAHLAALALARSARTGMPVIPERPGPSGFGAVSGVAR